MGEPAGLFIWDHVQIAWGQGSAGELAAGLLGEPVQIAHSCPACGSDRHGRPYLPQRRAWDISIAHVGLFTLVALSTRGRIGIDGESASARVPPDSAHPHDTLRGIERWVRQEAYLKATGEGLRRDPSSVDPRSPGVRWRTIEVDPTVVAAVCVIG